MFLFTNASAPYYECDLRIFDRALTSAQVQSIYNQQGMPGRGTMISNDRQIYVASVGTYPTYTPTSGAQFPVFNTSNVSFYSSGGTSGGTAGQYLNFGSQTFNMSMGFSAVCQFAFTNGIGFWERIFDFSNGADSDNILFSRNYTSTILTFEIYNNNVSLGKLSTPAVLNQNQVYTAIVVYNPYIGQYGTAYIYFQGATYSLTYTAAPRSLNRTLTYVGRSAFSGDAYSNVNINYLSVYNRVLTSDEINMPLPTPQITLTGAPLFNQLSPSATSSAVGAFSLRAVNGVTAKAVQVRPQGQFPPVAMTSNGPQTLTGYSFGGGGSYTASASSNYPGELPFYAFDKQDQANPSSPWNIWTSGGGTYNTTTGQYTGAASTTIDGSAYTGEWLQISLPVGIVLTTYTIFTWNANLGRGPRNFKIAGSNTNNGTDWVTVDTRTGITNWTSAGFSFTTTSTTAYSYFRMCVNYNNADLYGYLSISEWTLNGSNASWNTDFYADERGNLLTAPVVGTSLQNWLGGATGYVTKWYDQSGKGNDAIQNTAAAQPIIQKATKGPGYMVNFNGTSQFVTLSADSQFLNGTNITVNAVALRTATKTTQNWFFGTNTPSVNYQRFQFGFQSDTIISMNVTSGPTDVTIPAYNASNEPVYYMTGGLIPSRVFYQNDTLGGTNVNGGLMSAPTGYSYSIGNGNQGGVYYYQGNLFELLIFKSALDQAQVTQVYQNQLSYTGT
jgi:hypothetical protein